MKQLSHDVTTTKKSCGCTWLDNFHSWSWRKKAAISLGALTVIDLMACYIMTAFGIPSSCPFIIPHVMQLFAILLGMG